MAYYFSNSKFLTLLILTLSFATLAQEPCPLPSNLEGYKLDFKYEGYEPDREAIYQIIHRDHNKNFPPFTKDELGLDYFDIDGDGEKEIMVYVNSHAYCGTYGCDFRIFYKNNLTKESINFPDPLYNITISDERYYNHSYVISEFESNGYGMHKTSKIIWIWDPENKKYKYCNETEVITNDKK